MAQTSKLIRLSETDYIIELEETIVAAGDPSFDLIPSSDLWKGIALQGRFKLYKFVGGGNVSQRRVSLSWYEHGNTNSSQLVEAPMYAAKRIIVDGLDHEINFDRGYLKTHHNSIVAGGKVNSQIYLRKIEEVN